MSYVRIQLKNGMFVSLNKKELAELVEAKLKKDLIIYNEEPVSRRGRPKKRRFTAEHKRKISEGIRRANRMKAKRKKEMK